MQQIHNMDLLGNLLMDVQPYKPNTANAKSANTKKTNETNMMELSGHIMMAIPHATSTASILCLHWLSDHLFIQNINKLQEM